MNPPISVVLVEDTHADMVTARRMLEKLAPDAEFEHFASSEEFTAALDARKDSAWWPTLVVFDINLPGRSGLHLLRWIKADAHWLRLPVVVLSGSADSAEVQMCYDLGAAGYLTKPIGGADLAETWEAIVTYWCRLAVRTTRPNNPMRSGGG